MLVTTTDMKVCYMYFVPPGNIFKYIMMPGWDGVMNIILSGNEKNLHKYNDFPTVAIQLFIPQSFLWST
jgi:hypothetical protein